MKHPTDEELVAFRFGDVDEAETAGISEHLRACRTCQSEIDGIDVALAAAARMPVPERSDAYGAEVWARIEPRLHRRSWWQGAWEAFSAPKLAWAGGIAVLVLAAFVAGRMWPHPQAPVTPSAPVMARATSPAPASTTGATEQTEPARSAEPARPVEDAGAPVAARAARPGLRADKVRREILLVAVGDHLERSQLALMELVNSASDPEVDISAEQARARDLVVENRLYRQTAEQTGNAAITSVLDDLEQVLVELANSPSDLTKADFERVRQRIESQGIIFKVRVLGERVRQQEARPVANGRVQG